MYNKKERAKWRHITAFLSTYNRKGDYIFHPAQYMFATRCRGTDHKCRSEEVDQCFAGLWTSSNFSTSLLTRIGASHLHTVTLVPRDLLMHHIDLSCRRRPHRLVFESGVAPILEQNDNAWQMAFHFHD